MSAKQLIAGLLHISDVSQVMVRGSETYNCILRGADLDKLAVVGKHGEVAHDGQLGRRDGADNQVERAGVVLGPVLVLVGGNELGST